MPGALFLFREEALDRREDLGKEEKGTGRGKLVTRQGDTVEGQFSNGVPNGECIGHMADGSKFKAIFKNGKRNGFSIEEKNDGTRFEGNYSDGHREGSFVEKDKNGKITAKGSYVNGRRQLED